MRKSVRGGKKILGKSLCLVTGTPPSRKGGESDTKCIRSGEVAGIPDKFDFLGIFRTKW